MSGRHVVTELLLNPPDRTFGRALISLARDEFSEPSALIQGTGPEGSRLATQNIRLSNDDVQDLADSISRGVTVEISR